MVFRGKVERRWLAPAPDLHRVVLSEAVGRRLVGRIRNSVEELFARVLCGRELLLQRLELVLDPLELRQLFRRRLAFELAPRTPVLDARLDVADRSVCRHQLVEELGGAFALQRIADHLRVLTRFAQVDHARESRDRYASST